MRILINFLLISFLLTFTFGSCKKYPYKPDFEHAGGYVIGKEICKANPDEDFWLIDLSYASQSPDLNYGDTITIEGIFYKHMVKTTQLPASLKIIGKAVSFDFHLSANKVETIGCTVNEPVTYKVKEMQVIASFEIH